VSMAGGIPMDVELTMTLSEDVFCYQGHLQGLTHFIIVGFTPTGKIP
jgi:hypothetical protein